MPGRIYPPRDPGYEPEDYTDHVVIFFCVLALLALGLIAWRWG